nr:hypothetical protein [Tanacetum cinerariifolium]
ARLPNLVVGVAIAEHVHRAVELQVFQLLNLAPVAAEHVAGVAARNGPAFIEGEGIGQHVVGPDAKLGHHRLDKLAEAAADDI